MSRTSPFCFCLAFAYCESHFLSCTLSCHGRGFARAAFGSLVAGVVVSSQRRFARPALLAAHGYWTLALVLRRSFIRGIGGASPFASCGCLTRISARGREGRLRPRWSQALRLIGLGRRPFARLYYTGAREGRQTSAERVSGRGAHRHTPMTAAAEEWTRKVLSGW